MKLILLLILALFAACAVLPGYYRYEVDFVEQSDESVGDGFISFRFLGASTKVGRDEYSGNPFEISCAAYLKVDSQRVELLDIRIIGEPADTILLAERVSMEYIGPFVGEKRAYTKTHVFSTGGLGHVALPKGPFKIEFVYLRDEVYKERVRFQFNIRKRIEKRNKYFDHAMSV